MKRRLLIICIFAAVLMAGCDGSKEDIRETTKKEEITISESPFDENGSAERISLGFGYEKNDDVFDSENNKMNRKMWFENKDYELEVGILIFTNGILQPVSVEGQEERKFNIYKVSGKSEYNIEFNLISANADENVRIDTISLLNPNFKITEKTKEFGLCFADSATMPTFIECKSSVEAEAGDTSFELTELSDAVKEKFIITKSDGSVFNNLETSMNIQYFQNGEEINKLKTNDNMLEFDMDIYGGRGEIYNLYIFLNNEPIRCFDGKEYNRVTITADKTTNVTAKIDISDKNLGEYTQLFAVAVPVGEVKDSDAEVYKLSNIIVDNTASWEDK